MTWYQWVIIIWFFSGMCHILWMRLHGEKSYATLGFFVIWFSGLLGIAVSLWEWYYRKHMRL